LVATHNEVLARMAERHLAMDDGQIVSDSGG